MPRAEPRPWSVRARIVALVLALSAGWALAVGWQQLAAPGEAERGAGSARAMPDRAGDPGPGPGASAHASARERGTAAAHGGVDGPALPGSAEGRAAIRRCHLGAVVARESADVAAEIDGIVEGLDVRVGDRVDAGSAIATLDTRRLGHQLDAARADLSQARAAAQNQRLAVDQADDELTRRRALSGLLSQEEREQARFDKERAEAQLEAARADTARVRARIAELEDALSRSTVRAPFDGVISRRYLDPGVRVVAGTAVVRLIRRDAALVRFAVAPHAARSLEPGTAVRVETLDPPSVVDGVVEQVAPEIDPASRLLFVEARLVSPPVSDPAEGARERAGDPSAIPFGTEARVWIAGEPEEGTCFSSAP